MKTLDLSAIAALTLFLAACASLSAPPPGSSSGGGGGGGSGLAVPPASDSAQGAATFEGVPTDGPVEVPESVNWNNPGVSKEQNRADLESCYGYSWGQIQHDIRIEDDRATLRDDDLGIGFVELNRSMNEFDFKNRRANLFEDCMVSRGYNPN